jgi:FAD dependent oxidoreductase TIGR03364
MPRAIIVGAGILGTLHAREALRRGWSVVHLDAEAEPHDATVRSPGALSPSLALDGLELTLSVESRGLWDDLAVEVPGLHLRPTGSVVVALTEPEEDLLRQALEADGASMRGWELLDAQGVRAHNPGIGAGVRSGLYSPLDATVEPRTMLTTLRAHLQQLGGYEFHGGCEVHEFDADTVTDTTGRVRRGDLVVLCLGSRADLLSSLLSAPALLHRSRLQALQTEPLDLDLRTVVSDVHTLARHGLLPPATIDLLSPLDPRLGDYDLRFSCVQRTNGSVVIGEARESEEPFDFDIAERPAAALLERFARITDRPAPSVVRRWSGVLHECVDGRLWHREDLDESVVAVTGADQRGIILAPLIARDTFDWVLEGNDTEGSHHPVATGGEPEPSG